MHRIASAALTLYVALSTVGCGDTGQSFLSVPVRTTGASAATFDVDGRTVSLTRAEVGFGPAYFCATAAASSDLCPAAMLELRAAVRVDVLGAEPRSMPALEGVTGTVRSASFDYGVTWLAVEQEPTGHVAELGDVAARFEGTYEGADGTARSFRADVHLAPQLRGTQSVQGARTEATLDDRGATLTIAFDPVSWWRGVDFTELDELVGDPVLVPLDSRAHNALVVGMTATAQPTFLWGGPP